MDWILENTSQLNYIIKHNPVLFVTYTFQAVCCVSGISWNPFLWQMDDGNTPIFLDTVNSIRQMRPGIYFACIFRMLCVWLLLWNSEGMTGDDDRDNCDSGYVWLQPSGLSGHSSLTEFWVHRVEWHHVSLSSLFCLHRAAERSILLCLFSFWKPRMSDAEAPKPPGYSASNQEKEEDASPECVCILGPKALPLLCSSQPSSTSLWLWVANYSLPV